MPNDNHNESTAPVPPTTSGHPSGLYTLFFTEMWERFSYYGMRALLMVFMVTPAAAGGLGFETPRAAIIYGTYVMCVYMLSIPGGFLADNFLGSRASVLYGGIIIACGHFSMAARSEVMFFLGLVLIAVGTGLLKPNISTMVGSLYHPGDERRDAGFSIFYMGINLGAFIAPLITGYLAQSDGFKGVLQGWGLDPTHSWHWGFAAAGVGMTLGLIVYILTGKRLAHVGNPPAEDVPRPWNIFVLVVAGAAIVLALVLLSDLNERFQWLRIGYVVAPIAAILWFGFKSDLESKRIGAIFVFALAAMIFWAIFEQAGSTIALFAENLTDRTLPNGGTYNLFGLDISIGKEFPSAWFQSVNSLFVILLAPVFAWLWVRLGHKQPSSPVKFTLALVFLGVSFVLMVPAAKLTAEGKVSPFWIVALFFLQTVGELLLSPVGLSTMTKLAPSRLLGLVMGIWFLAAALGNKLAGVMAGEFTSNKAAELAGFFLKQAGVVGVATLILLALVPWVRKLMGGVR